MDPACEPERRRRQYVPDGWVCDICGQDSLFCGCKPAEVVVDKAMAAPIRHFSSGATRNIDDSKFDYEGFINPEVLHAFGEYMHEHRHQRDGSLRDSDNWQKGIPFRVYVKSLVRHVIDLWRMERGYTVTNPDTGQPHTKKELCCAIMFNSMGYLKELLDPKGDNV